MDDRNRPTDRSVDRPGWSGPRSATVSEAPNWPGHERGELERPPRRVRAVIGEKQLLHGWPFLSLGVAQRSAPTACKRRPQRIRVVSGPRSPRRGPHGPPWAGRGTMRRMTDQGERYDRIAAGYARWWAPVLAPAVADAARRPRAAARRRARDCPRRRDRHRPAGARRRWSAGRRLGRRDRRLGRDVRGRRRRGRPASLADGHAPGSARMVAFADALPFEDGTFDAGRCRRSSSSSSRTGRAPCARSAACCARAALLAYVIVARRTDRRVRAGRDLRRPARRVRLRAARGRTAGRATSRRSTARASELRRAGFRDVDGASGSRWSTGSRSTATSRS